MAPASIFFFFLNILFIHRNRSLRCCFYNTHFFSFWMEVLFKFSKKWRKTEFWSCYEGILFLTGFALFTALRWRIIVKRMQYFLTYTIRSRGSHIGVNIEVVFVKVQNIFRKKSVWRACKFAWAKIHYGYDHFPG